VSRSARLTAALALALVVACLLTGAVLGADPSSAPSALPEPVLESGDLRSDGSGPGLVGNPLLILGGVVLLGLATALATVLLVRLTRRA